MGGPGSFRRRDDTCIRGKVLHRTELTDPANLRLGAILAGGRSRRFGSPKLLARVGGTRLIERVAEALRQAGARPVLITAAHATDLSHLLPCRADDTPGLGPLGGLHTAVSWARELGLRGTLCVAGDLPFLSPALLRRLAEIGEGGGDVVVAPSSSGPLGVEPLCAWYPASAVAEIELRLASDDRSLEGLLSVLPIHRLAADEVDRLGDASTLFHNVNTPADAEAAEVIIARQEGRNAGG
jgi:molybdenum cofactor guanylyltransferase